MAVSQLFGTRARDAPQSLRLLRTLTFFGITSMMYQSVRKMHKHLSIKFDCSPNGWVVARALQPLECRTLAKGISQGLGRDRTGLLISDLGDVSCPAATVGLGGARRCLCSSVGLSQRNEQNFVDEYQNLGISVSLAFFAITQGAFQSFSGYALSLLEARSILPLKGKNNNPNVGMQRKRGHGQDHRSFLEESLDYCGDQGFFVTK